MRRLLPLALMLALSGALVPPASAARVGKITGRIVDARSGEPKANVEVTLTGARRDGTRPILRKTVTGKNGKYTFAGLPTGKDRFYALDAHYRGGIFAGRAISIPANTSKPPVIRTTLRVYPTISNPAAMMVRRDDIFAVPNKDGLAVIESVDFVNQTTHAYIGRAMKAGGGNATRPTLGFSLPPGAQKQGLRIYDSTLDIPGIVPTDFGFATTIAIPPGANSVTFAYEIPGDSSQFTLDHTALYPVMRYSIFAADPLRVEGVLLDKAGSVEIDGRKYVRYDSRAPLSAGDAVQASAVAEAGLSPGLVAGVAAAGAIIVGLLVWAGLLRRRRAAMGAVAAPEPAPGGSRQEVIDAIADLDLRYRDGDLSESEWERRRSALKERLSGSAAPGRAP